MKKKVSHLMVVGALAIAIAGCSNSEKTRDGMDKDLVKLISMNKSEEQVRSLEEFLSRPDAEKRIRASLDACPIGSRDHVDVLHYLGYVNPTDYLIQVKSLIVYGPPRLGVVNTYAIKAMSSPELVDLRSKLEDASSSDKDSWLKTVDAMISLKR